MFRDQLGQMDLKTGADGKIAVTWPEPGMYWVNVSTGGERGEGGSGAAGGQGAEGNAPPAPPSSPAGPPPRRAGYVTTLEVMAP